MATFLEAQQKAKRQTPQRVKSELFRYIRTIEKELANLNKDQIHENSSDVSGKPIGFYSKATEFITTNNVLLGKGGEIKKEGDPFDLKDTGAFLDSLFSEVQNDSIYFDTTDNKKNEVLDNLLSKDIFGLTDQDLRKAIDEKILPFLLKYMRKQLL